MADELDSENYHSADQIRVKEREILLQWQSLLDLLQRHQASLLQSSELMNLMREVETLQDTVTELEVSPFTEVTKCLKIFAPPLV